MEGVPVTLTLGYFVCLLGTPCMPILSHLQIATGEIIGEKECYPCSHHQTINDHFDKRALVQLYDCIGIDCQAVYGWTQAKRGLQAAKQIDAHHIPTIMARSSTTCV
jgi:hypothetical protein